MKAYQPYSWYRCSNQRCAMLTALPEGMIGRQLALLSSQTIEIESVILVCSHCNCVCNCTPIGRRAPIPVQVLSKSPRMSYVKLWLRCGYPECKSLTRLLVWAQRETSMGDLERLVSNKSLVGVTCCFGHPLSRAVVA